MCNANVLHTTHPSNWKLAEERLQGNKSRGMSRGLDKGLSTSRTTERLLCGKAVKRSTITF